MILPGIPSKFSKHIAIVDEKKQLTYAELDDKISFVAAALIEKGINRGTVCPVVLEQKCEHVITLLALWRIGAVACLLSPRTPENIINEQIDGLPARLKPSLNAATIMFTSGSSGQAKAVVHTIDNHYFNALGSNANIAIKPGDRWLLSLPLYHVSGLSILWRCFMSGGTVVLSGKSQQLQDAIKKFKITHVSLVTTQLRRILDKETKSLYNVKAILLGGGPISPDLIETAKHYDLPLFPTYGMTEMGSQVATAKYPGGPVVALKYRQLKIFKGEILVRGKTLFAGYLKNRKIQAAGDSQGWFHTGDVGTFNKKDGLSVLGRKDNMFISGGENIYPEEIEKALLNTGLIESAVVVPVKNIEYGLRPVAFIKAHQKKKLTAEKIIRQLKTTLPSFKIPRTYQNFPAEYRQKGIKPDRQALLAWLNVR
jgi:O-succinylbenzoic acid--CoA ligase